MTGLLDSNDMSLALLIFVVLSSVLSFQFMRIYEVLQDFISVVTALLLFVFPLLEAGVCE